MTEIFPRPLSSEFLMDNIIPILELKVHTACKVAGKCFSKIRKEYIIKIGSGAYDQCYLRTAMIFQDITAWNVIDGAQEKEKAPEIICVVLLL